MLRRWLLLTGLLVVLLGACGDPEETEARDPASQSPSSTSAPAGAPVEFRVVLASSMAPPPDSLVKQQFDSLDCDAPGVPVAPEEPMVACDDDGTKYVLEPASIVGGIESASAGVPAGTESWVVDVELDAAAAAEFTDVTADLVATGGQFAVVLEGRILTAPTVQGAITAGALEIAGNFTQEQAQDLADRLAG